MQVTHVIWAWMTGEWPIGDLDHRDRDKLNDRWNNLRPATEPQQAFNQKIKCTNTSGFKGVRWHRQGYYIAEARINGVKKYLGRGETPAEAAKHYERLAIEYHKEFRGQEKSDA